MIADALLQKHSCLWFIAIISLVFFHIVRAGAYWHNIRCRVLAGLAKYTNKLKG